MRLNFLDEFMTSKSFRVDMGISKAAIIYYLK